MLDVGFFSIMIAGNQRENQKQNICFFDEIQEIVFFFILQEIPLDF